MTNVIIKITPRQEQALKWLNDHGGTGVFTKDGQNVVASGIQSAFLRSTWIALRDARRLTIDGNRLTSLSAAPAGTIARNPSEHSSSLGTGYGRIVDALPGAE